MLAVMAVSVTVLASGSKGNCTVISSSGTRLLVDAGLSCRELLCRMLLCGLDPHSIDAILITHDAVDPVGFTFRTDGIKVGVCTDLGYMPASVRHHLRGCHVLMIESNHDLEMLRGGPYPWSVKQRVMSRVGHLSNDALADFLTSDYDGIAEYLILAHLSEQNNHPEIARMTAERALNEQRSWFRNHLLLAAQHEPLPAVRL